MPTSALRSHPQPREPEPLAIWPSIAKPATHRQRILIVEDNHDVAETLALLLDLLGHEVRLAHTGRDGVSMALGWSPDAVICDIGLPELNGFQVAQEIRSYPSTSGILLIALTAHVGDSGRRQAMEMGFDHYLTKPADPDVLIRLLCAAQQAR